MLRSGGYPRSSHSTLQHTPMKRSHEDEDRRIAGAGELTLTQEGWTRVQPEKSIDFEGHPIVCHANGDLTLPKVGRVSQGRTFTEQVESGSATLLLMRRSRSYSTTLDVDTAQDWEGRESGFSPRTQNALPVYLLFTPKSFIAEVRERRLVYLEGSGWFASDKPRRL